MNDVYLDGKSHDLSALSADFSEAVPFRIDVQDKHVEVVVNGEIVYTNSYSDSMGEVVGLRFKFIGLGEVQSFKLINEEGNRVL